MGKYSDYKGVSFLPAGRTNKTGIRARDHWVATTTVNGSTWMKHCETERGAAMQYDIKMIKLGRPPVNILKPA